MSSSVVLNRTNRKYLPKKDEIIYHSDLPNKTELVQKLLRKNVLHSSVDFQKSLTKASDYYLSLYIEKYMLKSERYDSKDIDENSFSIILYILQEFHIRLIRKYKIMSKKEFKNYLSNISESDLSYHWHYITELLVKPTNIRTINSLKKLISQVISEKQRKKENDHYKLISLYYESKLKFKEKISTFNKEEVLYNLQSISTYIENDTARSEIIRELMMILKNIETRFWLNKGMKLKEISENICINEYIIKLMEDSIKMSETDFMKLLKSIDSVSFLKLYFQINSDDFPTHWHHNTLKFMKYYNIEYNRRDHERTDQIK